jgi:hypothetical protein
MGDPYFELTDEVVETAAGVMLHRVRALRDLPNGVRSGELGGFIEKLSNLSGGAWVYGGARVSDQAWVSGGARVSDQARMFGEPQWVGDAVDRRG